MIPDLIILTSLPVRGVPLIFKSIELAMLNEIHNMETKVKTKNLLLNKNIMDVVAITINKFKINLSF